MAEEQKPTYDFDVALSFAGEDRAYVEDVNRALKEAGVRTFLDSDFLSATWGEDLSEFFDSIYRKRAKFAMLFISRHYAEKVWPRHERRSALARALEERGAYVLPIRLDDSEVEGLRPTLGYIDARRFGIDGVVKAFTEKLAGRIGFLSGWPGDRAPRTSQEVAQVRATKPPGWEYLYFAGLLHLGKGALEDKYLDHELGYAPPTGERVDDDQVIQYVLRALDDAKALMRSLNSVMDPAVQERAFGPPGTEGDPERVKRLAERWTSIYDGFLEWAARIRGSSHSEEFSALFASLAGFVDNAIEEYRQFVDQFVSSVDRVPTALATGETLHIVMTLTLTLPDERLSAFSSELRKVAGELGVNVADEELD